MNHFEFFELPVAFLLDEADLKRKYLQNSRKYHPDLYTLESEEKQAEMLELSAQNNLAYKVLRDFDRRMAYVLEIKGLLSKGEKQQLPQAFLFEMMEINESIMELEFDPDEQVAQSVLDQVINMENQLMEEIQPIINAGKTAVESTASLEKVKEVYLKKKYLWRIQENLNRFAPASKEAG